MRRLLLTIALLAALVWGGKYAYEAYGRVPAHQKARWCMERGDYEAALPHLLQANHDDPNNMMVVIDLAETYDRMGDKATAALMYRRAEPLLNSNREGVSLRYHRERFAILCSMGY